MHPLRVFVNQTWKACKYFHSPGKPASLKVSQGEVWLQNKNKEDLDSGEEFAKKKVIWCNEIKINWSSCVSFIGRKSLKKIWADFTFEKEWIFVQIWKCNAFTYILLHIYCFLAANRWTNKQAESWWCFSCRCSEIFQSLFFFIFTTLSFFWQFIYLFVVSCGLCSVAFMV